MDSPLSKLPDDSDELLALLLGLCHTVAASLDVASGYDALIADDLAACGGSTSHIAKVQQEFLRQRQLIDRILDSRRSSEGKERFNLTMTLQALANRLSQKLSGDKGIALQLEENLYLEGNSYQLKTMFESMMATLEPLVRSTDGACALTVHAARMPIPKGIGTPISPEHTEASSVDGIVISLCAGTNPVKLSTGNLWPFLKPYHQLVKEGIGTEELFRNTRWLGTTMANDGQLFFDSSSVTPSIVMFFPICTADDGADELEHYRCSDSDSPKTILVVDDEDMIWDVVMEMLRGLGYEVILAGDGREALDTYSANLGQIDLVVLDMLMPNMGGEEAFFLLKKLDPNVKVLISSGYVSQEEIQNVMDAGAVGFLRKPYRMVDLARKIHELLFRP